MKKLLRSVIFDIQWTFNEPPNRSIDGIVAVLRYFFWHFIWKHVSPYHVIQYHGNSLLVDSSTDGAAHAYISPDFDYGIQTILKQLLRPGLNSIYRDDVFTTKSVRIPCITLDVYCAQHKISKIKFLKIDVEGAELLVFQGANHLLKVIK